MGIIEKSLLHLEHIHQKFCQYLPWGAVTKNVRTKCVVRTLNIQVRKT